MSDNINHNREATPSYSPDRVGPGVTPLAISLSPREREVLVMVCEGLLTKEIAERLGVSVRTVETHREAVNDKISEGHHGMNAVQIFRRSVELGIVPCPCNKTKVPQRIFELAAYLEQAVARFGNQQAKS